MGNKYSALSLWEKTVRGVRSGPQRWWTALLLWRRRRWRWKSNKTIDVCWPTNVWASYDPRLNTGWAASTVASFPSPLSARRLRILDVKLLPVHTRLAEQPVHRCRRRRGITQYCHCVFLSATDSISNDTVTKEMFTYVTAGLLVPNYVGQLFLVLSAFGSMR